MGASAIVLASASPRRSDLLRKAGWAVTCDPSGVDEIEGCYESPGGLALANARLKWHAVAPRHAGIVLAADTVVWANGKFYGKPSNLEEARGMLVELRGRTHEVVTGVVVGISSGRVEEFQVSTLVTFREVDDTFIADYVLSIDPLDKAAGYAAQDDDGRLIASVQGSMTNVIGLPMERLSEVLSEAFGAGPQRLQR